MPTCAVADCFNKEGSEVSFHRFPSDEAILKKWIDNVSCALSMRGKKITYKSARVCSEHFIAKAFAKGGKVRKKLHKDAFPTKNMGVTQLSLPYPKFELENTTTSHKVKRTANQKNAKFD